MCASDKQIKVLVFKVLSMGDMGAAQPPLPKLGMVSTLES